MEMTQVVSDGNIQQQTNQRNKTLRKSQVGLGNKDGAARHYWRRSIEHVNTDF